MDQPNSPRPDPDDLPLLIVDESATEEVDLSCSELAPFAIIAIEESATERLGSSPCKPDSLVIVIIDEPAVKRPIPLRDLTVGFGVRFQKRLYETIELSCSIALVEHPKGVQLEVVGEDPSRPVSFWMMIRPAVYRLLGKKQTRLQGGSPIEAIQQRRILQMKLPIFLLTPLAARRWRRC